MPERLRAGSAAARAGLPAPPPAWPMASTLGWEPATPGCTGSAGGGVCYSSVKQINGHWECKNRGSFARCAPLLLSRNINQKGLCVILEF